MKLDKIKFARVIGFIERTQALNLSTSAIEALDEIIDVEVPQAEQIYPQTSDVNMLMFLMHEGTRKIEAIKMYRKLTGWGLKESKDQVDKYWVSKVYNAPDWDGSPKSNLDAANFGVRNAN